jgi:hypothetical protein
MNIPEDRVITVAFLREFLGLPPERPDGVRDLLVIPVAGGTSLSGPWRLALGDWPERWRISSETGPRYLVVLHGLTAPYFIAAISDIDRPQWGDDTAADAQFRAVPVGPLPHASTSWLAGCRVDTDTTFGWPLPQEQYAFW